MFSELTSQFSAIMRTSKQSSKMLAETLTEAKMELGIPLVVVESSAEHPTMNAAPAPSFPKAERWKEPQHLQQGLSSWGQAAAPETKKPVYKFSQTQRFQETKIEELTPIDPKYNLVKRNDKRAPIIDLKSSMVSQTTMASATESIGPGAYFPQDVKAGRKSIIPKGPRFEKEKKKYEDVPLEIKDDLVRRRPPTAAVMKQPTAKNANLITLAKQEQFRERLKMIYWQSVPLQIDRLCRQGIVGPVLRENYFQIGKMSGVQRRCAIMMLLDRLNFARGGFENYIATKMDAPYRVVYRRSTPKPAKPFYPEEPGPDYYYPRDDLLKPTAPAFGFARFDPSKLEQSFDARDYSPNEDFIRPSAPAAIIQPISQPHRLTADEIAALNRGPGFYDCLFSAVQKRNDIGVVKFQDITDANARENNLGEVKETVDAIYFPKYTAIDKNVQTPQYHAPANVKPAHMPEKLLFPEHWMFYDGDLNKVRAEVAKNVLFSQGLSFKQYQVHARQMQAFRAYLDLAKPQPQVGQYDPGYEYLDPHVAVVDFAKQLDKNLIDPMEKPEGEVNGDNLILEPKLLPDHVPGFELKKMQGREEADLDDQGDVLILDPKLPSNKQPTIQFGKMVGREGGETEQRGEPNEGDVLILSPRHPEKHQIQIRFDKQLERPETKEPEHEELILEPKKPERKVKGFIDMERRSSVKVVAHLRQKRVKQSSVKKK